MNDKLPTQRLDVQEKVLFLHACCCLSRIVPPTSLFRKSVVVTMRTISDAHWGRHGM